MGFITYDLIFLVVFILALIVFLYKKRQNLKREMKIAFLYKTQFGVKFIDRFAKKFNKFLMPTRWAVVVIGYILMAGIIWLLIDTTYVYLSNFSLIFQQMKAPPLIPLIPYLPQLFGLESYLPPLHFTYFIIAIGIVAISHEFAHGIFARLHNVGIKSTGFLFLGPLFGAFVEQDEKQMSKKKIFPQLSILGAGVFANIIMTIIFGAILLLLISSTLVPAGVKFTNYAAVEKPVDSLFIVGNSSIGEGWITVSDGEKNYLITKEIFDFAKENNIEKIGVYLDSPAINAGLEGAIVELGGVKTSSYAELAYAIQRNKPGEVVSVKTAVPRGYGDLNPEYKNYEIELGEEKGKAFLGISQGVLNGRGGLRTFIYANTIAKVKNPFIFYESKWGDFGWFVYYLLWWIVVINVLVALFNMIPVDPFDGGRFFYLSVLGITKSEKIAKKSRRFVNLFILLIVVLLMSRWLIGFLM